MSVAPTRDSRAEQSAEQRRRKRKERAAKNRAPEPKDIVSGAGQPLDVGVRRELEEQLGHDFSRVRLHTDRDAGVLTDLLGADAVAVGQDIFFREGAYRPGTIDGQRLLAHELLHTVQNPEGLGALRAGRDLGAVSLPQQAAEREAEAGAQQLVRSEEQVPAGTPEIEEGQATPGWMRYATVDADRMRAESLDPETVVDRLVNGVLRSLRGDPSDASRRVRQQLARLPAELSDAVLDGLGTRLPTPTHDRLIDLLDDVDREPLPLEASLTPHGVPDALEELTQEQDSEQDAWQARLRAADELENERIRQARLRKAEDPKSDDGASEKAPQTDAGAGAPAAGPAGAPQQAAERGQQEPAEAKSLKVEGDSGASGQASGKPESKGGNAQGGSQQAPGSQQQRAQQQAQAQPDMGKRKGQDAADRRTGAVRPTPVDKSTMEPADTRRPAPEAASTENDQDPDDEPLGVDEGGEADALAELEALLTEAEAEGDASEAAPARDSAAPGALGGEAEGETAPAVGKDGAKGEGRRPRAPSMSAEDAEAMSAALDEESEDLDADGEPEQDLGTERPLEQQTGPEPDSDAAESPDNAPTGTELDDDGRARDEAEDRDLASESRRADERAGADTDGGEGTGAPDAPSTGKLAKADEDARGQADPSGGSGGSGSGGSGGEAAGGGATDVGGAPAKAPASVPSASAAGAAAVPEAGGDTSVVPAADEVASSVPPAEEPQKHEPARPDDRTPVTAKAAPRPKGSGGGGGGVAGGGKAAAKPKKGAQAPSVDGATPESGLGSASGLPPHLALTTLKGVNAAVVRSVDGERKGLKGAPPTMERPVGSPTTVRGGPEPSAPGTYTAQPVGKTEAAQGSTPEIKGEKAPSGELPGADMKEPGWWDIGKALLMGLGKKLLSKLLPLDKLTGSIDQVPRTDKGLQGAKVGDAPALPLKDDSDPERTDKQARLLDDKSAELHTSGREDAARPMGEDQIYPDVPRETLTAHLGGGKQGGDAAAPSGAPGASLPPEAVSAVAEHEQGPQIKQAFGQARQQMAGARRDKEAKAAKDRSQYQRDVRQEVDNNTKEQADARNRGRTDIARSRAGWRKEQDDKLDEVDGKKGKQFTKARKDIKDKQDKTDKDVDQRTKDDQKKIDDGRTGAEKEATQKHDDGKKDSKNWFERGLDWIKEQFNKLKKAIKDVFEKARNLVKGVIDDFKKQVFKFIDDARKWVIQQINDFADALIRLGDDLLKDYPALRDKWRKSINGLRDAAIKKVNQAADKLKKIAGKLIDAFGGLLLAGLDLLEKEMLAAVELAETVTVKAMELGAALLKGLGEWAAIATDILSDPGGWIGKAKDAAVTGAKEHLFTEIKAAVKEWFNQKVQQLIGIPMEMFNRLLKGGTSKEEMAQMAWDAALPQLPMIVSELIVTKVVAKLIPGAGWVMAVIDALKTAYDALSSVLRAFGLFMTFLKAVKSGNGALPFAKAVASGVVALLELIYQWLVSSVGKYLGKVAKVLRGKASKLGKKRPGEKEPGADKGPDDPKKTQPPKQDRPEPIPTPGHKPDPNPAPQKSKRDDVDRRRDGRNVNAASRPLHPRPDKSHPDARRPGDRGPDGKRPGGKRPTAKKPDDKHPDLRKSPKHGRKPNKDAPGQKRKPTAEGKDKKPSVLSRVRNAVKNTLQKIRNALRRLGARARDLLQKLKNFARRLKDLWRRIKNRLLGRGKRRDDRRDDDSARREPPLPTKAYEADDGHRHVLRFHGKGPSADLRVHSTPARVPSFLADWKREAARLDESPDKRKQLAVIGEAEASYARAESLQGSYSSHAALRKQQSLPRAEQDPTYRALRSELGQLADAMKQRPHPVKKPDPYIPSQLYGAGRADDFTATHLNKSSKGTPADKAPNGQPVGWDYIEDNDLNDDSSDYWVKMHLLPDAIGGPANGGNLVPASGPGVNTPFLHAVEQHAKDALHLAHTDREEMIWYSVSVGFHAPPVPDGFPTFIESSWGGYEEDRVNRRWEPDPKKSSRTHRNPGTLPKPEAERKLYLNLDDDGRMRRMLKESDAFVDVLIKARRTRPFRWPVEVRLAVMKHERSKRGGSPLVDVERRITAVINGINSGRISLAKVR
ncbi:DUF4157 domain-containing protein [Streptomyces sp. NPDC056323]|uniref:eCIS core domain-containing protein n=1 Tax=Streptomyces sp. NPDC056323 TaxID=3345784 RepID=UPI0035DB07D1